MSRVDERWQEYCAAEKSQLRCVCIKLLNELVGDLKSLPREQRKEWTYGICRQALDGNASFPIRYPLFKEILFPELLEGTRAADPDCARWLAGLEHLTSYHYFQGKLKSTERGAAALLRLALRAEPSDERARFMLVEVLRNQLEYSLHELPAGVLYGMDGASAEQCLELMEDLIELQNLIKGSSQEERYAHLVSRCQLHFTEYPKYLACKGELDSYEQYLSQKNNH